MKDTLNQRYTQKYSTLNMYSSIEESTKIITNGLNMGEKIFYITNFMEIGKISTPLELGEGKPINTIVVNLLVEQYDSTERLIASTYTDLKNTNNFLNKDSIKEIIPFYKIKEETEENIYSLIHSVNDDTYNNLLDRRKGKEKYVYQMENFRPHLFKLNEVYDVVNNICTDKMNIGNGKILNLNYPFCILAQNIYLHENSVGKTFKFKIKEVIFTPEYRLFHHIS